MTVWDRCVEILEQKANPDVDGGLSPIDRLRAYLKLLAVALAYKRKQRAADFSVYVEKHIAGIRFMVRDPDGKEVDLSKIPWNPPKKKRKGP